MPIPQFVLDVRRKLGNDLMLLPGVAAVVFNDAGEVLLARRADTRRWAVIGGIVEPGEDPADCCVREVLEETGVHCVVDRLIGVYRTPTITYSNGNVAQYIVTGFACRATAGTPRVADDESLEVGYFRLDALPADLSPEHRQRVEHGAATGGRAFFRGGT
jgi:ADP-ribose pyrophosphatase YjhB (NUDIX family)